MTVAAVCWAVVPAAGIGSRMAGDTPKQYLKLANRSLLEHSLARLLGSELLRGVAVALHAEDRWADAIPYLSDSRVLRTIGGKQRADSVLAALDTLSGVADAQDWVLVHDAARPCLPAEDLQRLVAQVLASGEGAILAEPVVDTLKLCGEQGRVLNTVDRRNLWRAQTPQMFRLGELRGALQSALASGAEITDEASAMELAGYPVQLVAASPQNLKVTVAADLLLAEFYLRQAVANSNEAK